MCLTYKHISSQSEFIKQTFYEKAIHYNAAGYTDKIAFFWTV